MRPFRRENLHHLRHLLLHADKREMIAWLLAGIDTRPRKEAKLQLQNLLEKQRHLSAADIFDTSAANALGTSAADALSTTTTLEPGRSNTAGVATSNTNSWAFLGEYHPNASDRLDRGYRRAATVDQTFTGDTTRS